MWPVNQSFFLQLLPDNDCFKSLGILHLEHLADTFFPE